MTIDAIRHVYEAQPFQPFTLHLADGRGIPVYSREFMASAPNGRTIVVYQPDSSWNLIDLLLVTDLEVGAPPKPKRRKGRNRG